MDHTLDAFRGVLYTVFYLGGNPYFYVNDETEHERGDSI